MKSFELAIAFAIFFDSGKLGLEFFHELGLSEVFLHEGPSEEFDDECENNNGETEVANEMIYHKKDIDNRGDNNCIN